MTEELEERKVLKVSGGNEAPSDGQQPAAPMGDASAAPAPPMDGGFDTGGAPGFGDVPGGETDMGMGPEPEADGSGNNEMDDIFNQLSIEDQAAVLKYAKSHLEDGNEYKEGEQGGQEDMGQQPMFESAIFTKEQLDRIHESIRPSKDERGGDKGLAPQKKRSVGGKSPFNAPNFK